MGFPFKNDHFGVFWGVPPFKETPASTTSPVDFLKPQRLWRVERPPMGYRLDLGGGICLEDGLPVDGLQW